MMQQPTMEQPIPIYTNYDFYVPAFELKIKGKSLDREVIRDVISVSYTDSLDKLDSCDFTLNNWDAEKREFKYSDRTLFDPGTAIELYMGYYDRGGLTLMLRGQIVALDPDFSSSGQSTLRVKALNQLYKLHFKQETQVFENKTDTEIAQALLEKIVQDQNRQRSDGKTALNLKLEFNPNYRNIEKPHPYKVISNDYPIIFLMQLARHNGYDLYIEEEVENGQTLSKLHFHPPNRAIPAAYELKWGETLIGFKPTLKTKGQVAKVTVRGWNPLQAKQPIVGVATWDELNLRGLPNPEDMQKIDSALAGSEEVIADEPIHDEAEAKQKAKDHLTRLAKDLVTGGGSTVGLPDLRAGRPVYIRGLGSRYSGRYLMTSTTHQIGDSGYTTQFSARMEELK